MSKPYFTWAGRMAAALRETLTEAINKKVCTALFLLMYLTPVHSQEVSVFDQIINNIIKQELAAVNITSEDAKTKNYMQTVGSNGAFSDIPYSSTSQTNWAPIAHLDRMKSMILSYITPESEYYSNEELYTAIVNMLNYWHSANPTSTNWYNWEIGWPQRMGVNLSLMRAGQQKVPSDVESKILNRMKSISKGPAQSGSQGTGANKMDIALQWIYRTALQRDKTNLDFAISQFYLPLTFNTGEGLQSDYSYLQHGQQLYIGGYGASVLTATFKVSFYLEGTEYAGGDSQRYINNFVRMTYIPTIRGQYMLYGAVGRGMVRKGGIARAGFAGSLEKMIQLDPEHTNEYEKGIKRLSGKESADYGLEPYHRHFWRGDYTLHQRPGFTMDVRMASTRTYRCENGNGENLKGYFLTEGGTEIVQRGDEYVDIFPVWDWSRIPGTTTPAVTSIPKPAQWGQPGQSRFTGGVSDSIYGVTTYQMVDNSNSINTSGKKSWFFFDNEVVCLGSDIRSSNATPINTTVNQCLLNGEVTVQLADGTASTVERGENKYTDLSWINHDNISYYFPEKGDLTLRNNSQSGTWNSIASDAGDGSLQTKDVFKVWFDHGTKPQGAQYSYYIVPNTSSVAEAQNKLDDIVVINCDSVQATYNKSLQIVGAVFHKKGTLRIGDIEMSSSAPCMAMFTGVNGESIKAYVADPSYSQDSLTLYMKFPALKYKMLGCKLNQDVHYAGSTHAYTIDADTPDSVYIRVNEVILDQSEINLGYSGLHGKVEARISPSTASNKEMVWSSSDENVVKVDSHGNLLATGKGEATVTVSAADQVKAECTVRVEDEIYTSTASADAYVYDGSKGSNYGSAGSVVVRTDGTNYNRQGYFMFPLTELDKADVEYTNVKVKLMLYVVSGSINVAEAKWRVYPVNSTSWNESTINWNNKPAPVTSRLLTQKQCFIPSDDYVKENFIELDLTEYALAQYKSGSKAISLFIDQDKRASAGKGTSEFASKENAEPLKHPRLFFGVERSTGINSPSERTTEHKAFVENDCLYVPVNRETMINIYDMQGSLLNSHQAETSGNCRIFIGHLPNGSYLVKAGKNAYKIIK